MHDRRREYRSGTAHEERHTIKRSELRVVQVEICLDDEQGGGQDTSINIYEEARSKERDEDYLALRQRYIRAFSHLGQV